MCACDIRYCSQDAWFQVKVRTGGPQVALGTISHPRVPSAIPGGPVTFSELPVVPPGSPRSLGCPLIFRDVPRASQKAAV